MQETAEHSAFREMVRNVVRTEIEPHVDGWEDAGFFDAHELFPKLADRGLLGLDYDPKYGGQGADFTYSLISAEELGKCSAAGIPMAIGVQNHMATPSLHDFGTHEQKEEFLRPALDGRHVAAIAVTEPGAGSDVAGLRTSAVRDGDDWLISGSKIYITNGTQADWFCMLVRTSDEGGHRGMSQIIVPAGAEGFEVARRLDKLGNRASDTAELHLDRVRVPVRNTIGEIGRGFQQQMSQFVVERFFACCTAAGSAEQALARTREYMRTREVFGAPLAARQYLVFNLTELAAELDLLKALNDQVCQALQRGDDVTRLVTVGKLTAGRLERKVADLAMQVHGGIGYMEENWTARYFRDKRLGSIGGGADEVMLQVLARMDGLPL